MCAQMRAHVYTQMCTQECAQATRVQMVATDSDRRRAGC